jgi:hypothetical protein
MTKAEFNLRCKCEQTITHCEQTLAIADACTACDGSVFDRWELVAVLTQARRILVALDDSEGELRRIIDADLPIPTHWQL